MSGRRLPIVIVLAGLLIGATAVGERHERADAGTAAAVVPASMPAAGVQSSAWYCSGGPVGRGRSHDQITVSVVGSHAVRVAVDVMVAGHDVDERFVTVGPRSSTTIPIAKLSSGPSAAVVVQPLGGGVVVEQGYAVNGDLAMAPCATRASSDWYFTAGSSVHGAQTWVSVLNPFADDAAVDIEAYSENGFFAPASLQGVDVVHGSRLAIRIDQAVTEQRIVAVAVHARSGSLVVATQAVVEPRTGGLTNASLSLGALAPARKWLFADNRNRIGAVKQVVLANPGEVDASARLSVVADLPSVIAPQVVRVPATTAVVVDLSRVVPVGVAYTLVVDSAVPVVAETHDTFTGGLPGSVTEVGSTTASRQWSFAGGPFTATGLGGGGPRVPGGFDLSVVMKAGATDAQIAGVQAALVHNGHVKSVQTVTRAMALAAFRAAQRDNPALLASAASAQMPVTFDVVAHGSRWITPLTQYFGARAGVDTVATVASEGPGYDDDVVVFNPGSRTVRVSLVGTAGGSTVPGPGMTNVEVGPLRQVTISLVGLARKGVAVVVSATGGVVAERFSGGPTGVTRAPGVA